MAFAPSFSIEYYQVYCNAIAARRSSTCWTMFCAYIGMKAGEAYIRRTIAVVAGTRGLRLLPSVGSYPRSPNTDPHNS